MVRLNKQKETKAWDPKKVFRTTKCFSPSTNGYPGGFPRGFLKYLQELGYWGQKRCYLCAGKVNDLEAVRVDIRAETNPTHCEDARATSFPDNTFDIVIIDPPYTRELAKNLYKTEKYFSSINQFAKEASRIVKLNGLIVTLGYEVPRRIPNCNFIAVIGIYQAIRVAHMRCLTVSKKIKCAH